MTRWEEKIEAAASGRDVAGRVAAGYVRFAHGPC